MVASKRLFALQGFLLSIGFLTFGYAQNALAQAAQPPSVSTDAADSVGNGSAVMNATIEALGDGDVTTRGFEYGFTTAYGLTTTENSVLAPFDTDPFSTTVTGLVCGRVYHFRAYAESLIGPGYGEDQTMIFGCNHSSIPPSLPAEPTEPAVENGDTAVTPEVLAPEPVPPSPLDLAFPIAPPADTRDVDGHRSAPDSGIMGVSPFDGAPTLISEVTAGWFIRAPDYDSVYYVTSDLHRRPFLNSQTFLTWADSFDEVMWVTDATLASLPLGAPMLPHAGAVLVKIEDSPDVYVIEAEDDGSSALRRIPSPSRAAFLFGGNWAKYVIDLPTTIFHAFTLGADVNPHEIFSRSLMKLRSQLQ